MLELLLPVGPRGSRLASDERGASTIEYLLVFALVVAVVVGALKVYHGFGSRLSDVASTQADCVTNFDPTRCKTGEGKAGEVGAAGSAAGAGSPSGAPAADASGKSLTGADGAAGPTAPVGADGGALGPGRQVGDDELLVFECPTQMVRVAGGAFKSSQGLPAVVGAFCIDTTEVTVADYERCVEKGRCDATGLGSGEVEARVANGTIANYKNPGRGRHPQNFVAWSQANRFCKAYKKRLPTENEWEWAAIGASEGAKYPWGNSAPKTDQACWSKPTARKNTCGVGSYRSGKSPQDVMDLVGNVSEWTATPYLAEGTWVLRGASFLATNDVSPVSPVDRKSAADGVHLAHVGFRCIVPLHK